MSKDISDILKEVQKNHQEIYKTNKEVNSLETKLVKELIDLKKFLKIMDKKISVIYDKIQEFDIIMDAAEILEEQMNDQDDKYNTEWDPYEGEQEREDYENYDDYDNDEQEDEY